MRFRLVLGSFALVALVGCGSSSTSSKSTESSAVTATSPSSTTASPSTTAATTTTTVKATTTTAAKSSGSGLMPSVVGMNLQDAQDLIQSKAGVFFSRSYDCTGKSRSQIVDSNWVVVTQSPSAGSRIGEGDANLGVVKYGETRSC